jgi:hypothetical protein
MEQSCELMSMGWVKLGNKFPAFRKSKGSIICSEKYVIELCSARPILPYLHNIFF